MNRRITAVLAALLLACVGTFAVFAYAHSADARAVARTRAVTVYIAAKAVPVGTTLENAVNNGMLTQQPLPASSVPDDVVRSIEPGMGSQVAVADIAPGQVVLRPMFGAKPAAREPLTIPDGKVALSVQVTVPQAVSAYVGPNSQIAVFVTFPATAQGDPTTSKDAAPVTRMVLPRVDVIQVGPNPTANGAGQSGAQQQAQSATQLTTVLVTVSVTQTQAEQLIQAQAVGTLYLALLTAGSTTAPDNGLNNQRLFG
jgi:pilus assembly protein CpaB